MKELKKLIEQDETIQEATIFMSLDGLNKAPIKTKVIPIARLFALIESSQFDELVILRPLVLDYMKKRVDYLEKHRQVSGEEADILFDEQHNAKDKLLDKLCELLGAV